MKQAVFAQNRLTAWSGTANLRVKTIGKKARLNMRFSKAWVLMVVAVLSSFVAAQESAPATGVPVSLIVTAEPRHGSAVPVIDVRDVMVYLKHERAKVTDWVPIKDSRAALQLFLLIDDSSNTSLGSQLEDLKQFITSQPATTEIGVAYMQNGTAMVLQNLTSDHAL